jgi:hypothetical protein
MPSSSPWIPGELTNGVVCLAIGQGEKPGTGSVVKAFGICHSDNISLNMTKHHALNIFPDI